MSRAAKSEASNQAKAVRIPLQNTSTQLQRAPLSIADFLSSVPLRDKLLRRCILRR